VLFLLITCSFSVFAANEIKTVGNTGADFSTLKSAFDAVNSGTLTGNVTLRIIANTTETTSAILNASGSGSASYSSINIYPTAANVSVSGTINGALIDLNGADNVSIDGRINATGSSVSLSIINLSNSSGANTSTIRFVNDACNNSIRYCQVNGSQRSSFSGVVFFSSTTEFSGNDNNTVSFCNITCTTDVNRPLNIIYSEGSSGSENNNNTISSNNIYNFLSRSSSSNAINISANSTAFTISGNSFYETSAFTPTSNATYSFISINNTSGSGFQILNNFIGGSASQCGGSPFTKTNSTNNTFNGIYVAVGADSPTTIEGNKISNISWNNINSGNWTGIQVASGEVNVGTSSGNIIGETSGTSSIVFNSNNVGPGVYPIQINSSNNINCIANKIGALKATNARYIYCIDISSADGNTTINNNTIGSTATAKSIEVTTSTLTDTHYLIAIQTDVANNSTIKNNQISNLISYSTGSGNVRGIFIKKGTNNVSDNIISKISTASSFTTPLIGLTFTNSSFDNIISGNMISELEILNQSILSRTVIGMNMEFSGTNTISKNFVFDIYIPSGSTSTNIYGIKAVSGTATYSNNIIKLGTSVSSTIYGIHDSGSESCNIYHNTVYINGNPTSGNLKSYAFYSASNSNTINYQNNIFVNARSNSGATGKNYAAYFNYSSAGSLTLNYNVYYTSGTGGVLGFYASADKTDLPIITGQDANSLKTNPGFINANGSNSVDYKPVVTKFAGISGTGINEDFGGAARTSVPTIGAWEYAGGNMWKGFVNSDWANALNWTLATVPATDADITFDPYPLNHLMMDTTRTVNNIINSQSTYRLIVNGKRLILKGSLNFTNGAQIDATANTSTIVYEGSSEQYLNASAFLNGTVFNVRLNNLTPVVVSGNISITGNISTGGGRLDAYTNSPTITYSGSVAQTISISIYLLNRIFNLVANNSVGLTINAPIIVTNALTINSGKLLTLSPLARVQVNGTLLNNAGASGLVLNSASNGTASLIHNTNNVQATARRYIGGTAAAWHFLSSPISNQALSGDWKPTGTYADGTGYDLYVWDEPTNCWVYNLNNSVSPTWNSVNPSTDFIPGKGYLYALQAVNQTKQFSGQLNNGNIAVSVTNSSVKTFKGFNFLGNPYPSSIDWKNNAGFTRDMLETTGGGYNIWIWSDTAKNYGVYNSVDPLDFGTRGITRYIAPHLGFFVKAANSGTFVFKNAGRVSNEAANWLRVKSDKNMILPLSLIVNSIDSLGSDEIKMNFGWDNVQAGASKLFSPVKTSPSLYIKYENEDFSTFYFNTASVTPSIELNFKAGKDGKYCIGANEYKANFEVVLLEDIKTGKTIDLKLTDNYIFTSKSTDNAARFKIHFNKTALDELAMGFVNIFKTNDNINIDLTSAKGNFTIKIFDVNGIVFDEFTAVGGEQRIVSNPTKGVVFVKIYNNEKSKTFKLLN